MKQETYEMFAYADKATIVKTLETELALRNESPFWKDKVVPFTSAILSVLIPLRDEKLLFTPEGNKVEKLTPELFLLWSDFLSLKILAFTLQFSNMEGKLLRTSLDEEVCSKYKEIDLSELAEYLNKYSVNLEYENLDFPIANYNLHQGVSNVIKSLF